MFICDSVTKAARVFTLEIESNHRFHDFLKYKISGEGSFPRWNSVGSDPFSCRGGGKECSPSGRGLKMILCFDGSADEFSSALPEENWEIQWRKEQEFFIPEPFQLWDSGSPLHPVGFIFLAGV